MSRPIKTYSSGNARLSIWKNEQYNTYRFSLQKSYKDKQGQWQNTTFFNQTDLLNVRALVEKIIQSGIKEQQNNTQQPPAVKAVRDTFDNPDDEDIPF